VSTLINFVTAPLAYEFMQRALVIAVLVGAVCAVLSCYLVLKGWSLMGDAVSHAVLPGLVLSTALGLPLAVGAFAGGLFCALATGYLKENSRVKEDTVMGIVFSGMFGFGLVLFTKIETDQHLLHILFGNMLGVTNADLVETATIAGAVLLVILAKRRDLLAFCFDPQHAQAIGLPVRLLHYGLLVLLSLTIVASLKAVGIILVVAMLVAPGAIAYLLTNSFDRMLVIAVAAGGIDHRDVSQPAEGTPDPLRVTGDRTGGGGRCAADQAFRAGARARRAGTPGRVGQPRARQPRRAHGGVRRGSGGKPGEDYLHQPRPLHPHDRRWPPARRQAGLDGVQVPAHCPVAGKRSCPLVIRGPAATGGRRSGAGAATCSVSRGTAPQATS
jgi:manganese/iron transport system permease protein